MKTCISFLIFFSFIANFAHAQNTNKWKLTWSEEFNYSEVGWPKCGEIDLIEFIGNHPNEIYGTVHYPMQDMKHHSSGGKIMDTTLSNQFHIYAIEWNNAKMDFYFDDHKYHTFKIDSATVGNGNPFRKNFYLLINMAMGADWPGPIDDNVLPQKFEVDYVRIFKKK